MSKDDVDVLAQQLADFVLMQNFKPVTQRTPYYHMGATITDSVLQAGLNYRSVVYPRVLKLLTQYPYFVTTCDFLILMQTVPLQILIDWKNERKNQTIVDMSWFLFRRGIENEDQLAAWLSNPYNCEALLKIAGVGPKTIDYLKMLSGAQAIAIDRHLFSFLRLAKIFITSYEKAHSIYCQAARLLAVSEYELDRMVWMYMSTQTALI